MAAVVGIMEAPGDVLSPSSASKYLACSAKYRFAKIDRLPDPPTGALTLGSAVHAALGANFAEKCETHEDLEIAGVIALYREAWEQRARETEFRDDENPDELRAMGQALTIKYMEEMAPQIEPAAVEVRVSGRIGGVLVQGYVDLLDVEGRIIDIKTAARKPSEISSDYRFQVATYAQLTPGASGRARVDTLTKTKSPALVQQSLTIEQSDLDATQQLYPLVQRGIRAGCFMPNRSSFMCSRKYCAFWRSCEKEFGGKVLD